MFNQQVAFIVTFFSDSLMMATPERESKDVVWVGWTGEEEIDEEMTDFRDGQGEERLRLSLKVLREEMFVAGGPLFCRSSRGSRPCERRTARKA